VSVWQQDETGHTIFLGGDWPDGGRDWRDRRCSAVAAHNTVSFDRRLRFFAFIRKTHALAEWTS